MKLHDSRPMLTANSAGAIVMFAADSINAAHDVVFGWILSFKEKDGSLNNKTYWKRAARGLPQVSSFVYRNRQHISCDSLERDAQQQVFVKSFYKIKKVCFCSILC